MILWLDEAPNKQVGGKAANLMRLSHTFRVPKGFVLTPDDSSIDEDIFSQFDTLGASKVAVRSSGAQEDGQANSWAGQFDTHLNVGKDDLIRSIASCRASGRNSRAEAYGDLAAVTGGEIAVIVQAMVDARISGVGFSHHPVTKEPVVVIEAVEGLGEKLVSGTTTPDTYVCSDPPQKHLQGETAVMTDDEIQEVHELVRAAEQHLGYAVDIEWVIDEADQLYLLQARPITTL